MSERTGLILEITTADFIAQGEIAPLEGASRESFKKARHDLSIIEGQLIGLEIPSDSKEFLGFLKNFRPLYPLCASVRFGVESAMFDLVCQAQKTTLTEFLGGRLREVSTAVLLQGPLEQIVQEAKDFARQGYEVFKVKVGNRNIPLDFKKVDQLREILPEDALIRLDANKAWSFNEAVLFGKLIGTERIDFIEEPLKDISQIDEFYQQTHIPIALDETLSVIPCGISAPGRCSSTLAHHEGVNAYVLKPMVLGGITVTLDWIEQAKNLGKKAVISSCFESSVGLKVLKNLALLTDQVPGLGAQLWLR